jgi:hypothetical protein
MNVRGMYKSKDDLDALVVYHDPDIISFTETRITSNIDPPAGGLAVPLVTRVLMVAAPTS